MNFFIVEDHPLVASSLKKLLEDSFETARIVAVKDLKEAYAHIYDKYDLMILDINIKGEKSFEYLKEAATMNKEARHVIFTSSVRLDYHEEALKCGARGYILKENMPEAIIYAINTVMRGNTFIDPIFMDIARSRRSKSLTAELTDRERELFKLVGKGYTNQEIAEKLFISINTVKKHITRILEKTELEDRTKAVMYCQNNYV